MPKGKTKKNKRTEADRVRDEAREEQSRRVQDAAATAGDETALRESVRTQMRTAMSTGGVRKVEDLMKRLTAKETQIACELLLDMTHTLQIPLPQGCEAAIQGDAKAMDRLARSDGGPMAAFQAALDLTEAEQRGPAVQKLFLKWARKPPAALEGVLELIARLAFSEVRRCARGFVGFGAGVCVVLGQAYEALREGLHWAPRTRKQHQQEHRPHRPSERSDLTQHAKG